MPDYILKFSLFAVVFLVGGYLVAGLLARRREARARRRVSRAMTRANDALEALKQQMGLIESHSREYFHTLVLAEYPRLQDMVEVLDTTLKLAARYRDEGDLVRSLSIALWMREPEKYPVPVIKAISKDHRDIILDWISTSRELLLQVTEALEKAHAENVDSGIQRRRKDRRPTEMDLRRLRENLVFSGIG